MAGDVTLSSWTGYLPSSRIITVSESFMAVNSAIARRTVLNGEESVPGALSLPLVDTYTVPS